MRGFSITEEDSITNDAPIPTYPTFYEICKQCWTMYEPCKEYQYYDCIEGECGEHGTHNNSAQSRKTRSMMIEKVPGDVNVASKQSVGVRCLMMIILQMITWASG